MYAVKAVYPDKQDKHLAIKYPMAASAAYSQNLSKELSEKRTLHNELIKIRESIQANDKLLVPNQIP